MLAINIDDKNIEKTLYERFKNIDEIKSYIYTLIVEDMEDKRFGKLLSDSHKKNYVEKKEVFDLLNSI